MCAGVLYCLMSPSLFPLESSPPPLSVFRDLILKVLEDVKIKKRGVDPSFKKGIEALKKWNRPGDKGRGIVIDCESYNMAMNRIVLDGETYNLCQINQLKNIKGNCR